MLTLVTILLVAQLQAPEQEAPTPEVPAAATPEPALEEAPQPTPAPAQKKETTPAVGSVPGLWAFPEIAVSSSWTNTFSGLAGVPGAPVAGLDLNTATSTLTTRATAGYGFIVGEQRISATLWFAGGGGLVLVPSPVAGPVSPTVVLSSLDGRVALVDLLNERHTGLRLTPVLGLTAPVNPRSFTGSAPVTTALFALQLERRFGATELALRSEANASIWAGCIFAFPCPRWSWANGLQAEGWLSGSVSLAARATWNALWHADSPLRDQLFALQRLSGVGALTVAAPRHFGVAFELFGSATVALDGGLKPIPEVGGQIVAWFRSDQSLQRNWLDR